MRSMTFLEMNYNSLLAWDYINLPFQLLSPFANMSFSSTIRNMFFNTKLYELQLKLFPVLVELHEQMKSIHLGLWEFFYKITSVDSNSKVGMNIDREQKLLNQLVAFEFSSPSCI